MTYIGRTWLYWRNLTSIGRISLLPAEYDFHWQNMVYTCWLSLLLVEYDLYWQNMTSIGRIWFILAYCHSYWQNMQPIKSVLPFCSALPIQYTQIAAIRNTAGAPGGGPRPTRTWVGRGWSHLLLTYDWCCPLNVLHAGRGGAICGRFLVVKLDNAENSAYMQGCPTFPLHVSSCSTGIGRRAISLVDIYLFIYLLKIAHEVHDRRTQH